MNIGDYCICTEDTLGLNPPILVKIDSLSHKHYPDRPSVKLIQSLVGENIDQERAYSTPFWSHRRNLHPITLIILLKYSDNIDDEFLRDFIMKEATEIS